MLGQEFVVLSFTYDGSVWSGNPVGGAILSVGLVGVFDSDDKAIKVSRDIAKEIGMPEEKMRNGLIDFIPIDSDGKYIDPDTVGRDPDYVFCIYCRAVTVNERLRPGS